jgi:hypothetical protein
MTDRRRYYSKATVPVVIPLILLAYFDSTLSIVNGFSVQQSLPLSSSTVFPNGIVSTTKSIHTKCNGWVQGTDGEWEWEEDDPNFEPTTTTTATIDTSATATPQLPSGKLRPKQSLGQNFLKDPNTVAKIIRAFHDDATKRGSRQGKPLESIVELGPGAGALTDRLVENYGTDVLQCIELDPRSVEILEERYPSLTVHHADVLQVNYPAMAEQEGQPLVIIGNLPYYITSQILFALADASHYGAVDCATVTMQWEVAQRMVAPTCCKVCPHLRLSS